MAAVDQETDSSDPRRGVENRRRVAASQPTNAAANDVMTAQEVAEYLRFNVMTVYKLAKEKRIPGAIKVGRCWRFKRALLDAAFEGAGGEITNHEKERENPCALRSGGNHAN